MNDEFELDSLLKQMAETDHPDLPSPGLIWWRAQILKKQQEKQRIERPLIFMYWLAIAICTVISIVLGVAYWDVFRTTLAGAYSWLFPLGILAAAISLFFMVALLWSRPSKA
jgi:undecaprenyl pyrophosphate phosphatase UppP